MGISLLSNKYSNHVYQVFPSIQLLILQSTTKLKEKLVKHQQRKESFWLLFKKPHTLIMRKIRSTEKLIHNFCTGVGTNNPFHFLH